MTTLGRQGERKRRLGVEAIALTPEEIEDLVGELETRLDRLRALYDMYFTGIERLEPNTQKKDVERRIYQLRKEQIRNTALRFRFNMLVQRYNTMLTYWMRVCRAIEEGRYRRDILRRRDEIREARQRRREEAQVYEVTEADLEEVVDEAYEVDVELEEDRPSTPPTALLPVDRPERARTNPTAGLTFRRPTSESSSMPAVRPPQTRAKRPRSRARMSVAGALSEKRLKEIYSRYLEVRTQCKETVHNVPFEKMAKALRSLEPELRKRVGGRTVDFEVTVKNGKAFLKPVAGR